MLVVQELQETEPSKTLIDLKKKNKSEGLTNLNSNWKVFDFAMITTSFCLKLDIFHS